MQAAKNPRLDEQAPLDGQAGLAEQGRLAEEEKRAAAAEAAHAVVTGAADADNLVAAGGDQRDRKNLKEAPHLKGLRAKSDEIFDFFDRDRDGFFELRRRTG